VTCSSCGERIVGRHNFCPVCKHALASIHTVNLATSWMPNHVQKASKVRPQPLNSWERGVAMSHRPDGSAMPYLDAKGNRIGIKAWSESKRREFAEAGQA
jgi:hypothetical protein